VNRTSSPAWRRPQHSNRESLNSFRERDQGLRAQDGCGRTLNAHPGIYQDTLADMETIRTNPTGANRCSTARSAASATGDFMDDCATARVVALEQAAGTR